MRIMYGESCQRNCLSKHMTTYPYGGHVIAAAMSEALRCGCKVVCVEQAGGRRRLVDIVVHKILQSIC